MKGREVGGGGGEGKGGGGEGEAGTSCALPTSRENLGRADAGADAGACGRRARASQPKMRMGRKTALGGHALG